MRSQDELFEMLLRGQITDEQYVSGDVGISVGDYVVKTSGMTFSGRKTVVQVIKVIENGLETVYHFDTGTAGNHFFHDEHFLRLATQEEIAQHIPRRERG